ncbi:MAG: flagellar export protein FliJ [Planctomycetales bacterium]
MQNSRLPLESLDCLHRSIRDQEIGRVTVAQQHATALQARLDRVCRLIEESEKQSAGYQAGEITSIELLTHFQKHRSHLRSKLASLTEQKQRANSELNARHHQLLEAEKQVKMIEKLNRQRLTELQRQQAAQELQASDEWAAQQRGRT